MFDLFDFDLPGAVTEQLTQKLQQMHSSLLTEATLLELAHFQREHKTNQGVYQLIYEGSVVYIGKADRNAKIRLEEHLKKLKGRRNIQMDSLHFRCLLLPRNWSPNANESLLISHYQAAGQCRWNQSGFGSKDPGKERDGTEPNWFDRDYPIRTDLVCMDISEKLLLGQLLSTLKIQIPYYFRYKIGNAEVEKEIDLTGVPRTVRSILERVIQELGPDWQVSLFNSHITLYKERRTYKHAEIVSVNQT
jgi:hypothetical protein